MDFYRHTFVTLQTDYRNVPIPHDPCRSFNREREISCFRKPITVPILQNLPVCFLAEKCSAADSCLFPSFMVSLPVEMVFFFLLGRDSKVEKILSALELLVHMLMHRLNAFEPFVDLRLSWFLRQLFL